MLDGVRRWRPHTRDIRVLEYHAFSLGRHNYVQNTALLPKLREAGKPTDTATVHELRASSRRLLTAHRGRGTSPWTTYMLMDARRCWTSELLTR